METAASVAALSEYAETIGALHSIDKKNQAARTLRSLVTGFALVALGVTLAAWS